MRFSATWIQLQKKQGFQIHFDDSSSQDWHTDVHTPDASALNNNIRNITGSYVLLYRAVYNLVENAIKYNRPKWLCHSFGEGEKRSSYDPGKRHWHRHFT